MANKQKHKYGIGYNTRDQIKALAGSAKRRSAAFFPVTGLSYIIAVLLQELIVFSYRI